MSDKIEVIMSYVKSTKNTYVYASVEQPLKKAIPTLYINKNALKETPPKNIVVTVEETS